jgi:hypothetical protein
LGYEPQSRHNLGDAVPAFIEINRTTRAEVLLGLGEPDAQVNAETFAYTSSSRKGGIGSLVLAIVPKGVGDVVYTQRFEYRRLSIEFDDNGVVKGAQISLGTCWGRGLNGGDLLNRASSCLAAYSAAAPTALPATELPPPAMVPAQERAR